MEERQSSEIFAYLDVHSFYELQVQRPAVDLEVLEFREILKGKSRFRFFCVAPDIKIQVERLQGRICGGINEQILEDAFQLVELGERMAEYRQCERRDFREAH